MYSRKGFIREKVAAGMRLVMFAALFVLALGSCADRRDVADVLSEAFALVSEGKYDDAQLKALEVEELVNNSASIADREALARLYGIVYYQQNLRDKAKDSNLHALEYAIELNDTALIFANQFNLGLCATASEEAIECFQQAVSLARESGQKSHQSSALEKLAH